MNSTGPATGTAGTAIPASSISSVFANSSGSTATGTITFTVFGPSTEPSTCTSGGTTVGTATVSGNSTYHPSAGYTPTQAGNYWWYASYGGDGNNNAAASACGSGMSETVVAQASPTLTVAAPTTDIAGTAIAASSISSVFANSSGSNATGTITFTVFGPQASAPTTCTSGGTTVGTATPAGNGTYSSSAGFTPTLAGNYWWYVSSPADSNNNAANSACPPTTETTVNAAAQNRLVLSATSTTPTAGAADNLTITATDQYGNIITSYTGSHNLTFGGAVTSPSGTHPTVTNSSGAATNFGSTTAITFTNGVASVSGSSNGVMTLYDVQSTNITVTDGTFSNGTGLSVTVGPTGAASLTLGAASTTPTAGAADNLTVTAIDAYGNTATSYTGSKNLTFGGASAIGSFTPTVTNASGTAINFGSATAISFTSGQATVSGSSNGQMALYKATTSPIVVSDGTINNGGGLSVTVNPATLNSFTWSAFSTTTPTVGSPFTATLSALDAFGNAASGYMSATQCVTFSGPANSPAPSSTSPLYPANGSCATGQSSRSLQRLGSSHLGQLHPL